MVMIRRTVLIQRDENGFGLRVTSENPVFVESVKSDGAAWKAGIRAGDRIIKVNGSVVTNRNHQTVVHMIQNCREKVALTLHGSSNQSPNSTLSSLMRSGSSIHNQSTALQNDAMINISNNNLPLSLASSTSTRIRPFHNSSSSSCLNSSQRLITPPLPANDSTLIEFEKSRTETIKKMLGDEREFLAKLYKDEKYPNEKESEIKSTLNRIRTLEDQLSSANEMTTRHTIPRYILPLDASFANLRLNQSNQSSGSRTSSSSSINLQHQQSFSSTGNNTLVSQHNNKNHHHSNTTNSSNGSISRKHLSAENLHFFTQLPSAEVDCSTKKSHSFGQYDLHQGNATNHNLTNTLNNQSIDSIMNSTTSSKDSSNFSYSNSSFTNSHTCLDDTQQDFDVSPLINNKPNIDLLLEPKNVHLLLNFFHHLLTSKQDANPLLFYILTDLFKKVCENPKFSCFDNSTSLQHHIRKWAFEIYSTFLFNDSPLRLNCDLMKDQNQFNELLNENFTSATTLVNTIFDPHLKWCKELINQQIDQFQKTLSLYNGNTSLVKKIAASLIVECLTADLQNELPTQVTMNASASSTLLTQITILVSYLLNSSTSSVASDSTIQSIAQLTCFISILYHCFPHLLVSNDENANTLAKLIPVPVYLSFHQAHITHPNQMQHKRHKSLPASSSNNQTSSSAIPYHLSSSSHPTGNHHHPQTSISSNHHNVASAASSNAKTLLNSSAGHNQIFLKNGHIFTLPNTSKPNICAGCNQSIWAMFGWHCQHCLLIAHHWCLRFTAEQPCPGPVDNVLDQCSDLNQNNIHNLQHLSSSSSTRSKSKNIKSTGGRLLENILKNRAESLKHRKEDANKCTRKKSDPSISSSNLFSDFSTTKIKSYYSSSDSDSDLNDYQFTTASEHSFNIFNDNSFNRDDQTLIESTHDRHQLSLSNSSFVPRSTSSTQLSTERKKADKRQDVINELISTEKTHVKNLKILNEIFFRPIFNEQLLAPDQMNYVFSNHSTLYEIHSQIYQELKKKKREIHRAIQDQLQFPQQFGSTLFSLDQGIGQLLVDIFEGEIGKRLEEAASIFCANQTIGGDILRNKLKKDSKLSAFLTEAEANKCCRRLQLKDMLASCFQRITKYPLLMDNLMKETPDKESEEYKLIERACKRSKSILTQVNECVKNKQKLIELQRKTIIESPQNYDFTQKILIYEGQLTFRIVKKSFEVHVLLCTNELILLLKEGDKYSLKNINKNTPPIVDVKNVITRKNATDNRGFYLISNRQILIYEFIAASESEKKNWVRLIDEAIIKSGGGISPEIILRDLTLPKEQEFKDETENDLILNQLTKDSQSMSKSKSPDNLYDESRDDNTVSKVRIDGTISYVKDEDVNLNYNRNHLFSSQPVTDYAHSSTSRGQTIIERIQMIDAEIEKLNTEKQQLLRELNEEYEHDRMID